MQNLAKLDQTKNYFSMPIRMVEDEPGGDNSNNIINESSSRRSFSGVGGLGGSLGNILGALLPLLIKRPKLLLILIAAGVVLYFLFGRSAAQ